MLREAKDLVDNNKIGKIKLINVESFDELTLINNIGKKINKKIKIGIRLNPDIDSQTLGKISTGNKTDK